MQNKFQIALYLFSLISLSIYHLFFEQICTKRKVAQQGAVVKAQSDTQWQSMLVVDWHWLYSFAAKLLLPELSGLVKHHTVEKH